MKRPAPAIIVTALLLAGCSATATAPAAPSVPVTQAPAVDRTAEVKAAAGGTFERLITKATEVEPGRLAIATTLTGEQGTEGVALCVKVSKGWSYLTVAGAKGSTIATFNHPRNPGVCAKV